MSIEVEQHRAPVTAEDFEGVTGAQIRAWLTARGWTASDAERGRCELGRFTTWRSPPRDGQSRLRVFVFDHETAAGAKDAAEGIAYHFGMSEREVLDQLVQP